MFNSFFRGLLGTEESPTKVLEVRSDNYTKRPILYREESIILYGPNTTDKRNNKERYYEIVLHRPFTETLHQMFSLFRSECQDVAEDRFISYKDRIPLFIKLTKECSIATLQRLCDTLADHTSWNVAHLAAHFGSIDLFNNVEVKNQINDVDMLTGATPIMVAVKCGNLRMVQSLISLKCALDVVNFDGDTVFHYAATSNKDIIVALANASRSSIDKYNKGGYTALHLSCRADRPECVRALISAGADVNLPAINVATFSPQSRQALGNVGDYLQENPTKLSSEDMKHGGTPLHWAVSREVIEALVDKKCHINAVNFDGRTALHVMVLRGRLECVVSLLSHGAEVNSRDKEGNTPLHLAVREPNVSIVQALIVFGAELDSVNNTCHTARHLVPIEMCSSSYDNILYILHAVGAKRCSIEIPGCKSGCSSDGQYTGVPPTTAGAPTLVQPMSALHTLLDGDALNVDNHKQHKGKLLCLDGGGIRGLVLVQILLAIETIAEKPITHSFDWISGTSTGGIIALALSVGRTLREVQRLYFKLKDVAFVGSRPYSSEALENILKEYLGTETLMSDIQHPKLMILAVVADKKPVELNIFRNYKSPSAILDDHLNITSNDTNAPTIQQKVWAAARATGAAPSYFRAFGKYLDGGLIGNNPTLDALTELSQMNTALRTVGRSHEAELTKLKLVVSCGTGIPPTSKLKEIDVFRPESLWDTARLAWGITAIGALLVDQATAADGRVVERGREWCSMIGTAYCRFSPRLTRDVAMDEKEDDKLVAMLWETQAYMHQHANKLLKLKNLLND